MPRRASRATTSSAQYTTSVAVQDLDAVRQALGYARIALYGSSYGTRVAQHYARRYPGHTQALILDGVVPPTQVLGTTTPLDAEESLQRIFARCRADAACFRQFGDPAVGLPAAARQACDRTRCGHRAGSAQRPAEEAGIFGIAPSPARCVLPATAVIRQRCCR